jgi:hypothetical protein
LPIHLPTLLRVKAFWLDPAARDASRKRPGFSLLRPSAQVFFRRILAEADEAL